VLELKNTNLAIEFAQWIGNRGYNYYNVSNGTSSWFDIDAHSLDCNTKELFELFWKEYQEKCIIDGIDFNNLIRSGELDFTKNDKQL
jgi:hypothetical protein